MIKFAALFLYRIYTYLIFFPLLPVTYIVFSLTGLIFSYIPFIGEKITIFILSRWAKLVCFMIPVLYKVEGLDKIDKEKSYVIMSNHTSLIDALVIYSVFGTKIRAVMKKELRQIPLFGYTCERMGIIAVDRAKSEESINRINDAKKKLKNGTSIFFFPEGTRSKDGNLKPFKKGAFHIALDMKLPILPISIIGASKICPNGTLNIVPGKVTLQINDVIKTESFTKDNIEKLVNQAHQSIKQSLENN